MDSGIELAYDVGIKVLVELHDSENVQLSTHLKGFAKVLRVLLHIIRVDVAHINKRFFLALITSK